MNKIKNYMAVAALLLAGFTSCAVEQDSASGQNASGKGTKVTIKINNGASATTRATAGSTGTLTGADRENQITYLYAVLYKDKNSSYAYYKTFACTHNTDPGHENEYTFNVEDEAAGGVYYMYLIANPTTALKAVLDADNSGNNIDTEEDLHSYVVTPVLGPAPDITTVEDFVMTSPRTQIDMKGNAETVVDGGGTGIVLTRLAVRIDIDATALNITNADAAKSTTFEITKVTMNTRYTESDLMRGGSNGLSMGMLATASNVEFSGFTAVSDYIETNNKYWKGAIYSCENYDTSNPTILTIEGVYKHGENQALNVSQQVVFRDVVRDGSGNITSQDVIPLQRNHLYKVVLTPKYNLGALEFEKIDYAIQVVDWQNGETIKFTGDANLTHQSTPSFTVRNAVSVSGTESDGVTNPTLLYAGIDDHSIYLIVTSETTGTMLECPTFPSTQYGLVSSATTNDANGNLVETYKIDIDNNISFATDYTFTLSNAINTSLARTFVLKRRPKLPLEYMAETNLTDRDHFAADNRNSGNYYWGRSTVYAAFNNGGSTTVAETGSKGWHLPSFDEMMAIAPVRSTYYLRWNSNHTNENISETVKIGSETFACTTTYKVVDYTAKIEYVLRYMTTDNKYRSIYRYEAKANPFGTDGGVMMEIKCRYLGPDDTHITNSDIYSEVWWADDSYETLVRYIPASGHTTPDRDWDYNSAYSSGKITWPGQYGYFWIYSSPSYFMDTHPTSGNLDFTINQDSSSALGVPVRLWSDE